MATTRTADQNSLIKLYLAAFLRAPEFSGYNYWSEILAQGNGIARVAWDIFSLPIVQAIYPTSLNSTAFVSQIYQNVFGKAGDSTGIAYWASQIDTAGLTRGELVLAMINAGLNTSDGTSGKAYILNRYTGAQYTIDQQVSLQGEIPPESLIVTMATVNQNASTLTAYSNTIRQLALSAAGRGIYYSNDGFLESQLNDGSMAESLTIVIGGDTFKGVVGDKLGTVSKVPAGLTATLVKSSDITATLTLSGKASAHGVANSIANLTVTFGAADVTSGNITNLAGTTRNNLTVTFYDLILNESGGTITGTGQIPGALIIDLASDSLTLGGSAKTLLSGAITVASNIDLSKMAASTSTGTGTSGTAASATLRGDAQDNTLIASGYGDSIEGRGGNDTLKAGNGIDKFIFATSSAENGNDTIIGFTQGTGGDVLNFKAFLNKTGTTNLTTRNADDTAVTNSPWANGDVIVAQGYGLDTPAEIATLFGAGKTFAAPTIAGKAVLVTTDILGDARVWYITNQSGVTAISADEVQQVATIQGINNLTLVGLVSGNFA